MKKERLLEHYSYVIYKIVTPYDEKFNKEKIKLPIYTKFVRINELLKDNPFAFYTILVACFCLFVFRFYEI